MSYYQVAESCKLQAFDWNSKWDLSSSTVCNSNKCPTPFPPISASRVNQEAEFTPKSKVDPVRLQTLHNYYPYEGHRTFENPGFTTTKYGKVNNWPHYSGNRYIPEQYTDYASTFQNEHTKYLINSFVKDEYNDFGISNRTKFGDASRNSWNYSIKDDYGSLPNQMHQYDWNQNSIKKFIKIEPDDFSSSSSQFKVSDSFPSSNSIWSTSPIKEEYINDVTVLETYNPNNEHNINLYNSSVVDSNTGRGQTFNVVNEISNDSVELLFERAGLQDLMQNSPDELLQIKEFDELFIEDQPLIQEIKQEIETSGHEINAVTFNRKHYNCSYCAFNTNGRERLAEHIERLHMSSGYNMRSTRRRRLQNYVDKENLNIEGKEPPVKSKDKSFKCSECAYTTNHAERLKKHTAKKHLIEHYNRYNSWDQDLKFQSTAVANRTQNQSQKKSGSKNHKCPQCGYKAHRNDRLMKHIEKVHSKKVCYKCSHCDFVSTYNREYYAHMTSHYAGPVFRCEACSYKSKLITAFIAHQVTHTGDRLFNCTICSFSCKRKYHLKGHMISHSKVKSYSCEYCTKKYSYKCSLVRHQKTSCKKKPT